VVNGTTLSIAIVNVANIEEIASAIQSIFPVAEDKTLCICSRHGDRKEHRRLEVVWNTNYDCTDS